MYKQRGAVEACWAHNSEVGGSKPFAAISFFKFLKKYLNKNILEELTNISEFYNRSLFFKFYF